MTPGVALFGHTLSDPVADADGVGREDGGGNALRLFSPRHMVPVR